jgi:MFS family permease
MSNTTTSPVPQLSGGDARVISVVGFAHSISHFMHMLLPPMFPLFMQEFSLSFSQVGMLVSTFFVISGIGQALSGFVVDRFGARPVLFSALFVFLLAVISAATAQSFHGLFVAAALAGLGNSPFHPVDFSILNQKVSAQRLGHAFSVHGLSGSLGWALAPVFLVGLSGLLGWRGAYWAAAALVAACIGVMWFNREQLRTEVVKKSASSIIDAPPGASNLAFMRLPVVWWCFAFFLTTTMTLFVVQSYSASIGNALFGLSVGQAAAMVTGYLLASAAGMFVGGFVASNAKQNGWSSDKVITVCMAFGAVLMAVSATGWLGPQLSIALLITTGFAVGIGGPSRDMLIKQAAPPGATGRVYGTVYSGLDIGFALSPLVFGVLMDRNLFQATLFGAALMLVVGLLCARQVGARLPASANLKTQ